MKKVEEAVKEIIKEIVLSEERYDADISNLGLPWKRVWVDKEDLIKEFPHE